jgi:hypothetical protein
MSQIFVPRSQIAYERIESFAGGEDSFKRATLLDPDQSQHLLNVIVRDDFIARTRYGADKLTGGVTPYALGANILAGGATFDGSGHFTPPAITVGATYVFTSGVGETLTINSVNQPSGAFVAAGNTAQFTGTPHATVLSTLFNTTAPSCLGLHYYSSPTVSQLVSGFGTGIWKYDGAVWSVVPGWSTSGNRLAMAQGVDQMLISDVSNNTLRVYDGTSFTACTNNPVDPPVGASILAWHTNRMFASGVGNLPDTIFVSNFLAFGNGQWNATTRSFRVGTGDGQAIMGLASMQDFTLCCFKTDSIWLLATDPAADSTIADQDTAALSQGIGLVGRDAWCAYGNDLLFFSQDGVRSVVRMIAAAGQWQLSAPLSQPIQPYIDRVNRNAWQNITVKKYQEFAFFFVPLDTSVTNNACLVWNGRLGKWMGMWTWNGQAVEITRFNNINRLVFGDNVGNVNMWKDYSDRSADSTYTDNGAGYATQLYTRSFLFQEPVNNKSSNNTIIRFNEGNAAATVNWVQDEAIAATWTVSPSPSGSLLRGPDLLGSTFTLASTSTLTLTQAIRGLPEFNEAYLQITTTTGWFALRNITVGAYVNPLLDS